MMMSTMMTTWAPRARTVLGSTATKVVALLAMAVAAAMLLMPSGNAEPKDYSLYSLASSTSSFFGNAVSPEGKDDALKGWETTLTSEGSGGSMLGYSDPDMTDGVLRWLQGNLSGSSGTISYDVFASAAGSGDTRFSASGVRNYAYYGATLNALGIDSTSTTLTSSLLRAPMGAIITLLFIATVGTVGLFEVMTMILQFTNPFALFYQGVAAVSPELAAGMRGDGAQAGTSGLLSGLANWIGTWYQVLSGLSWNVMVPIFVAVTLTMLLIGGRRGAGGRIKNLVIRLLFIGLGVPLLGTTYTAALDSMNDMVDSGNNGATQVVLSTYVDFDSWANRNRLYLPGPDSTCPTVVEWDMNKSAPTGKTMNNLRTTAMCINNTTGRFGKITPPVGIDKSLSTSVTPNSAPVMADGGSVTAYGNVIEMLLSYTTGAKTEASSFEGNAKGEISDFSAASKDNAGVAGKWFTDYSSADLTGKKPEENPVISVKSGTGLQATTSNGVVAFSHKPNTTQTCDAKVSDAKGNPLPCNLSPLSMYNYLNTGFDNRSMTVYSSEKVASGATREVHNAVSPVGTGVMGFVYWFNSVVLLCAFVVIGWGYALGMIFTNMRRMIQLITAIPFAVVGFMSGIAKAIVYTLAMIMELFTTMFLYVVVQQILISLPQIVEGPFAWFMGTIDSVASIGRIAGNGPSGDSALLNYVANFGLLSIVISLISSVVTIWFTIMALRVRKSLLKGINEALTKMVEMFTGSQVAAPGMAGGGMGMPAGMRAAAAGAAAGAGPVLSQMVMGAGDKPGEGQAPTNVGGLADPVTTGSGPGRRKGGVLSDNDAGRNGLPAGRTVGGLLEAGSSGAGASGVIGVDGDPKGPDGNGPGSVPSSPAGDVSTDTDMDTGQGMVTPAPDGEGYVDAEGNPVTAEGQPLDEDGNVVEGRGADASEGVDGVAVDGSGAAATAPSDEDEALADEVHRRGGLSTGDDDLSPDVTDGAAMDAAKRSVSSDMDSYAEQDAATKDAALSGAKTVGKGAEAVARGAAGDEVGAAGAGADALGHAGDAKGKVDKAREIKAARDSRDGTEGSAGRSAGTSTRGGAHGNATTKVGDGDAVTKKNSEAGPAGLAGAGDRKGAASAATAAGLGAGAAAAGASRSGKRAATSNGAATTARGDRDRTEPSRRRASQSASAGSSSQTQPTRQRATSTPSSRAGAQGQGSRPTGRRAAGVTPQQQPQQPQRRQQSQQSQTPRSQKQQPVQQGRRSAVRAAARTAGASAVEGAVSSVAKGQGVKGAARGAVSSVASTAAQKGATAATAATTRRKSSAAVAKAQADRARRRQAAASSASRGSGDGRSVERPARKITPGSDGARRRDDDIL